MTVLIIGGGLAGLGAASILHQKGEPFVLIEKEEKPGGLARTVVIDGWSFDRTGHYLHSRTPFLEQDLRAAGVKLESIERRAGIAVSDVITPYPIQYNLWALPESTRSSLLSGLKPVPSCTPPSSFAEAIADTWGPALLDLFFRPYNEKLWGRKLEELPPDCAGPYMPEVDWERVEAGCEGRTDYMGYNGKFAYPAQGRLGEAVETLAEPFRDNIRYGFTALDLNLNTRTVTGASGEEISFTHVVSTVPLPGLLRMIGRSVEDPSLFNHTSVRNVRVGFRGRTLKPWQWLYVPGAEYRFCRVGLPVNVNPLTCPPGSGSLSIECGGVQPGQAELSTHEIACQAIDLLSELGVISVDSIEVVDEILIDPAYVVFRAEGRSVFDELRFELEEEGVTLAGRYGVWDYLSMDEAYLSGRSAALKVACEEESFQ